MSRFKLGDRVVATILTRKGEIRLTPDKVYIITEIGDMYHGTRVLYLDNRRSAAFREDRFVLESEYMFQKQLEGVLSD